MKTFTEPLKEYRDFQAIRDDLLLGHTPIQVSGCVQVQKSHFIHGLGQDYRYRLIVTYNDLRAKEIVQDYKLYDRNVYFYPAKDIIFYNADVHGNAIVRERMAALKHLLCGEPCTIVMSISAGVERLFGSAEIQKYGLSISAQSTETLSQLREKLMTMGYRMKEQVSEPGEYAVRGGILDVYPLTEDTPYRIEYWGDEVDSIRSFDVSNQRSIENVAEVRIFPAAELVLNADELAAGLKKIETEAKKVSNRFRAEMKTEEGARIRKTVEELRENVLYLQGAVNMESYVAYFDKETVSIFDYFPKDETLFVLDEPLRIQESAEMTANEFAESMTGRLEKGYILPGQMKAIFDYKKLLASFLTRKTLLVNTLNIGISTLLPKKEYDIAVKSVASYNNSFETLVKDLENYKRRGYRVLLVSGSHTRAARLAQDLRDYEINAFYSEDEERVPAPKEIMVTYGNLRGGFEYPVLKFVVIAESDIFGKEKRTRKPAPKYQGNKIHNFQELAFGDYVVHENRGLGIYRGIEQVESNKVVKDYIKVEYAEGGVLYVPVTAMDVLQKYADADAAKKPKLNRLGGAEWTKTKTRVQKAVREIAGDLVKLYALRENKKGHAFGKDTVWQKEFEELFPYEETDDQLKAIMETKEDMESTKIMDRLVCGDVGYGKTEIAIRAAFKAVLDGMQVAILVPTTILAQQHYNTFSQRLLDFPVRVDMLSRFRTPTQQKKTIESLAKGSVDIVIGTHRLLSKDIRFKNLGLLIVDEEQRFGVTHKEKIKQMRDTVDALTLTATPIPRTLHMSLIGIRDMSVLEEPPVDRLPIQTFVLEHNDEMIREAINRELARDGQVFYVYNRVQGIDEVAYKLQQLCPEAIVAYAHGQMSERELEKIMFRFISGEIDVLVSTTIIETGMDISNVNTILIDDADRMGLSQLYQLRGRVGRSNRTAYAFIMYRRDKMLSEVAEKRLSAIREFTDLGSGFKISMRDLEIRGAGNLLGAEQSGHMEAVGYDLYCKMLNDAVRSMKGELPEEESFETAIEADMDAYIPSTYIKNEMQKLDMYKRIALTQTVEDMEELQEELVDRFGDLPASVNLLVNVAHLKAIAHKAYVEKVIIKEGFMVLQMYERAKLSVERLPEFLNAFPRRISMTPGKCPTFTYTFSLNSREKQSNLQLVEDAKKVLEQLARLAEA